MTVHRSLTFMVALSVLVLTLACNRGGTGTRYGDPIDPAAQKVTLAELIAHPDQYEGKTVVVDGEYGGKCAGDDGDFYFKNRFDMIEAEPPTLKVIEELKAGMSVRLYGVVKVRRGGKSEPGYTPREADVRIAAKGVEVL